MQVWLAIVAILQLFSMIIIRHRILRPVTIIRDQMIEISKGNLSSDFSLEPDTSEIGNMSEGEMVESRAGNLGINVAQDGETTTVGVPPSEAFRNVLIINA